MRTILAVWLGGAALFAQTYTISTVTGNGTSGFSGDNGAASGAQLNAPFGLTVDASRNIYIADQFNNRIRKVTADGTISTVAGDGTASYKGDGAAATSAGLNTPTGVALDANGNLYIADNVNGVVRKVTSGGTISTVAGNNTFGNGYSGDRGPATNAQLNHPSAVWVDANGNLYIVDTGNHIIRKVTTDGNISTIAGNPSASGSAGDGSLATAARVNSPRSMAMDAAGNIYIADTGNHKIRKIGTNGIITTVAGTGSQGFAGDGGLAVNAQLFNPYAVAIDSAGNLYIADYTNQRIRKVGVNGIITTIAGSSRPGYSGDGGPAIGAQFNFPTGVAVDKNGNVYVADNQNHAVRLLTPSATTPPSIDSITFASGFGGFTTAAAGSYIEIKGSNLASNTRQWANVDFNGFTAPISLDGTTVTVGAQQAFVSYISANQVNAILPFNVPPGPQQVFLTSSAGSSSGYTLNVAPTQPGLLAVPSFNVGGKQYAVAVFNDFQTFVGPVGAFPGITSRPARPGEQIVLFGLGFGPVTPTIPAGQVVLQNNATVSPVQVFFGSTPGVLQYSGLAQETVGLYQFNVVVPAVGASDAVPLSFTLAGTRGAQTLYTAVQ